MTALPRALMVYCTCPNADTAVRLADAAVAERLAACVNRLDGVNSVFLWDGQVSREAEILLIAKTIPLAFERLSARWQALHPYELPEIIAVPIAYGSESYFAWIESCVTC